MRTDHTATDRRHSPPALGQVPVLLARFLPHYLRHVFVQPYRGHSRGDNVRELFTMPIRRHQIAVYDAVLDIMLKGYAELAGHALRPETGQVAVMLTRVGFAFDDEYERREAGEEALELDEVLHAPQVQRRLQEWRALMAACDTYDSIREFLVEFVAKLYQSYRRNAENTIQLESFDRMMESASLDSGGLLVTLAHVVGRLHGAVPTPATLGQLSSLGVNGKLADDMIDFRSDVAGGRPNLLQILAKDDAGEDARVALALSSGQRMNARWWRRSCPLAYGRLVTAYEQHEAKLTSNWLRLASRLMWTPALFGRDRAIETRGRI